MRKAPTPWEKKLWRLLKSDAVAPYKFRRQVPIDHYIADFVNFEKRLIVELDGSQHADSSYDKKRDVYLRAQSFQVLRFWNNEMDDNAEGVMVRIMEALKNIPHRNAQEHFGSPARGEWGPSAPSRQTIELRSPPFAACYAGVNYYHAMLAQLHREFPAQDFRFTLCCGDDAAIAHDALRLGFTHVLCACNAAQFMALEAVARRMYATLERSERW